MLPLVVGLDHAEVDRLVLRHRDGRDGHAGARVEMFGDHLARVHPVDVVGAEDAHDVGPLVVDQVQVLVDRIGRALEPVRAAAHLGGHRRHVVVEHRREAPRLGDVAVEAVALVLREHDDLQIAGVGEVRQREIDQPVGPGERHGRLGPVVRQRLQSLSLTARQDDDEHGRVGGRHCNPRYTRRSGRCCRVSPDTARDSPRRAPPTTNRCSSSASGPRARRRRSRTRRAARNIAASRSAGSARRATKPTPPRGCRSASGTVSTSPPTAVTTGMAP